MNCDQNSVPINLGNPQEFTVGDFAEKVVAMVSPGNKVVRLPATKDDPKQRKPDITRAAKLLNWRPKVDVNDGLKLAIEYFKGELGIAT